MRQTVGIVLMLACACIAQPEPEPEQGEDCLAEVPVDPTGLPTRAASLGVVGEDGSSFAPYAAGADVAVVYGGQGFTMITPSVQVPAESGDESGACWRVDLEHLSMGMPSEDEIGGFDSGLVFENVGGAMRAGPIFDILDNADDGTELELRVTVTAEDFVASQDLTVVLRQPAG